MLVKEHKAHIAVGVQWQMNDLVTKFMAIASLIFPYSSSLDMCITRLDEIAGGSA